MCPEKCRPEDNKNKISLVYGRTIDAWGMVSHTWPFVVPNCRRQAAYGYGVTRAHWAQARKLCLKAMDATSHATAIANQRH